MSDFFTTTYNPDVLSCLANLSNDEVLTPPDVVNKMLDMLPQELFSDRNTTFLDPACKSGVFLREIAKRLLIGLESEIPDLQERIDHIYQRQLFGIAITELTSLLSRRSLYCSKYPNSKYSVTKFDDAEGNIRFKRIEHVWKNNKCIFCGASKAEYDRDEALETHAYEFIHTTKAKEIINMKFDVIIGNPPYQLGDGGGEGASAIPIYHKFIEQAKKLNPRYLSMIIPARWYSGGKGLDSFRKSMLEDDRLSEIHDFPETDICFPGLNIRGGVCYFLWNRDNHGDTKVLNYSKNGEPTVLVRPLLEKGASTFIRYNNAVNIVSKVKAFDEDTMDERVQSRNHFGIPSNFSKFENHETIDANIKLYRSRRGSNNDKQVYVSPKYIRKNLTDKDKIKVLVSKASPGGDEYPHMILGTPFISERNSVCTETYLIVDFCNNQENAKNLITYLSTRFFRFLVSLIKNTQNISKGCFAFVPMQDFSEPWTDEKLYAKYGITEEEQAFIESMIRPMELNGGANDE